MPLRGPVVVGLEVTLIVQLAPPASDAPQLFDSPKPTLAVMLVIPSVVEPMFVTLTSCGLLVVPTICPPKLRLAGDTLTKPPVPLNDTVCKADATLSVTLKLPVLTPSPAGVKVTLIVQLAWTLITALHVLVWLNSPVVVMLVTESGVLPMFVTVIAWGALEDPTVWAPKLSGDG